MPVISGLTTTLTAGKPYYRITSLALRTGRSAHHKRVVNGQGGVNSSVGARYNHPGVASVYLTEDIETCLAEKLFYFQREVLTQIDIMHISHALPPAVDGTFCLWEISFREAVAEVFDLTLANAPAMGVIPSLMLNPSQDYEHLKDRRAKMQATGYKGLRAPSSRAKGAGNLIVLFDDQGSNVEAITPFEVCIRMVTKAVPPAPFTNHALEVLDFVAGDVKIIPHPAKGSPKGGLGAYGNWTRVEFNH